jgi:hypothetical protein
MKTGTDWPVMSGNRPCSYWNPSYRESRNQALKAFCGCFRAIWPFHDALEYAIYLLPFDGVHARPSQHHG